MLASLYEGAEATITVLTFAVYGVAGLWMLYYLLIGRNSSNESTVTKGFVYAMVALTAVGAVVFLLLFVFAFGE